MIQTKKISAGDRFIPQRVGVDLDLSHYKLIRENYSFDFDQKIDVFESSIKYMNHAQNNFRKRIYQKKLWSIVAPFEGKILNFSDPRKKNKKHFNTVYVQEENWPAKPRKRPLIGPPSIVLDMPDLDDNICHNIIDWSSKGYLATVYENEVHLWHSENKMPYVLTNTDRKVRNCVKWNKTGTQFAMALESNEFAIWDLGSDKIIYWQFCFCTTYCKITAMEWSPEGFFLTGCNQGRIVIWSNNIKYLKSLYPAHNGAVINLRFSCQGRYLVTTGTDCKVRLYIWSQMQEYFQIICHEPIKSIAWHPWKDSLLCLGEYRRNGYINLWNVNTQKEFIYPSPVPNNPIIDSLTWNSITGELVISNQVGERNIIVVLSNVNKITDAIEYHVGRVPYLMWGDDGMKLATASTDETLCIWDFLGNSKEKQKALRRIKAERKKFSTNPFDHLNLFGSQIR